MSPSVRKSPAEHPTGDEANEIQLLLRVLLSRIDRTTACGKADGIILDTDIDGIRCMFIKSVKKSGPIQIVISPRERTIARMVAAGHPNKTIASVLRISTWTVSTHLRRVFAKLGVGSRAAMVAHLMESGILTGHIDKAPAETHNGQVS